MSVLRALAAALAVTAVLAVAGCGGDDDSVSQDEAQAQAEEAAQDARQQEKLKQLEDQLKEQDGDSDADSSQPAPAPAPTSGGSGGSGDDCGGGVRAGPNTSCAFALNVAGEYNSSGGATRISVYSPTTGQTYRMTCSTGSPNVCTGGNNASVYIP